MPATLTFSELNELAGIETATQSFAAPKVKELSFAELNRIVGVGTKKDDEKKDEQGWLSETAEAGFKGTSYGIAAQALGIVGPPPENLDLVQRGASTVLGFVADPVTWVGSIFGAAVKEAVIKKIGVEGIKKAAESFAKRSAIEAIQPAVQGAVLEAGKTLAAGEVPDLVDVAKSAGEFALFGPASQVPTAAGKIIAGGLSQAIPPILEGAPVGESLALGFGTELGVRAVGKGLEKLRPRKPGDAAVPEQTPDAQNAVVVDEAKIVTPPDPKAVAIAEKLKADYPEVAAQYAALEGDVSRKDLRFMRPPGELREIENSIGDLRTQVRDVLKGKTNEEQVQAGQEVPAQAQKAQGDDVLTPNETPSPPQMVPIDKTADLPPEGERARPDLAMPVTDPNARAALNEADRLRNEAGEPKVITDVDVQRMASERIAANGPAERARLMDPDWVPAADGVDTAVAVRAIQAEGQRIPDAADPVKAWRDAKQMADNYREGRGSTSRELRQGNEKTQQKALAGLDKGDGQAFFTVKELVEAPPRVQKKLDSAREAVKRIKREAPKDEPTPLEAPKVEAPKIEPTKLETPEPPKVVEPERTLFDTESAVEAVHRKTEAESRPARAKKAAQAKQQFDADFDELAKKWATKGMFSISPVQYAELAADGTRLARSFLRYKSAKLSDFLAEMKAKLGQRFDRVKDVFADGWRQARREEMPKFGGKSTDAADLGTHARELHRVAIELNIEKRNDAVSFVHENLKKIAPLITRKQTMDAMSGYGRFRELSKDQIEAKVREQRQEIQLERKLLDMSEGKAPAKSGSERQAVSDEGRRLTQQVNEAKRKGGYVVTDPARQLSTAVAAIKTSLRNQTTDLAKQIETREKIVKTKTSVVADPEIATLRTLRDELKKEFNAIFPKEPSKSIDPAKLTESAIRAAEKSIAEYERRIATGELSPAKKPSKTPVTQKLAELRDQRDTLADTLADLRREKARAERPDSAVEPNAAFKIKPSELTATEGKPIPPTGFKGEPKAKKQGPETEKSHKSRLAAAQKRYDDLASQWATELVKVKGKLAAMGHDVDAALAGNMEKSAHAALIRDAHALKSTTGDKMYEWWNNSILSGPATQMTNLAGNVTHAGYYFTAEKVTDAVLGSIARSLGYNYKGAYFGELKHVAKAMLENGGKAWSNFLATWRTEIPQFYLTRGLELEAPSGFQRAVIAGAKGKVIRTPWRLLAAVDDMVKTLVADGETSALAYRQARNEGLKGDAIDARMRDLINDPASEVHQRATDTAIRLAFQEHGKLVRKVSSIVHDDNVFSKNFLRYLMPFVTTPFNILETGVRKSPFGSLKLGKRIFDAAKTGDWTDVPIRAAEQTIAWGVTMALLYNNDPANPWITGSDDPNRKYAIKIGGTWYSYGRVEPFATMLGLMVDSIDKIHKGADLFDSMKAPFDALLKRVDNQTFFAGISDLMKAAQSDRPTDDILKMAAKFPASWVPNLIRAPIRALDENVPERRVWGRGEERTDRLLRRGLQNLEVFPDHAKHDLWGRAVPKDGGWGPNTDWLMRVFSPSSAIKYQETIGDRLIQRWNAAHPTEPVEFRIPNPYFQEDGKTYYFTDAEYDQYVREAGRLTQQRIIAAQAANRFNVDKPTERDIKRLRKIIETSRERVRNAIKRSRRKAAREAA